jgi:hypothetical protein
MPWAAPTWLYPLTWVLMIMPLFFVAGGFANTLTVDRMHRQGTGGALPRQPRTPPRRPAGRVRDLLRPGVDAAAWLGWLGPATELSRQLMQLLWFITVYLVIVAAAPGAGPAARPPSASADAGAGHAGCGRRRLVVPGGPAGAPQPQHDRGVAAGAPVRHRLPARLVACGARWAAAAAIALGAALVAAARLRGRLPAHLGRVRRHPVREPAAAHAGDGVPGAGAVRRARAGRAVRVGWLGCRPRRAARIASSTRSW